MAKFQFEGKQIFVLLQMTFLVVGFKVVINNTQFVINIELLTPLNKLTVKNVTTGHVFENMCGF